jgi:hypothetical protein
MYQAITTKYLGPTNVRGARVKASAGAGSMIVPWDSAMNLDANHRFAAKQLAMRQGWSGRWHGGFDRDGVGCWVLATRDHRDGFQVK